MPVPTSLPPAACRQPPVYIYPPHHRPERAYGRRREGGREGGGLRRDPAAIPRGIPHRPSGRYRLLATCPPPFNALTPCLRGMVRILHPSLHFPPDGHPPSPPTATPHRCAHRSAAITRPSLAPGRLTHRRFTDFPRGASAQASPSVSRIPGLIPQFPEHTGRIQP